MLATTPRQLQFIPLPCHMWCESNKSKAPQTLKDPCLRHHQTSPLRNCNPISMWCAAGIMIKCQTFQTKMQPAIRMCLCLNLLGTWTALPTRVQIQLYLFSHRHHQRCPSISNSLHVTAKKVMPYCPMLEMPRCSSPALLQLFKGDWSKVCDYCIYHAVLSH